MNAQQIKHAERMRSVGMSYRSIGTTLGVNESTVRRALKKGTPPPKKRRVTVIIIEEEV